MTGRGALGGAAAARAIENQAFVIAAGQGRRPARKVSYGKSMIVDPWGEVLAKAPEEGECVVAAELDFDRQDEVREKLPACANRVRCGLSVARGVRA